MLGSFGIALFKGEFSAKGGSAPLTRFVLGFFVMIGCLMFLGCPFRMILRLAGGDLNALLGGLGFVLGILAGVFFLKKGYSLKRSYSMARLEGFLFPAIQVVVFILLVAAPAFIYFTEAAYQILVDNHASRENTTRYAQHQGYQVQVQENGGEWTLTFTK